MNEGVEEEEQMEDAKTYLEEFNSLASELSNKNESRARAQQDLEDSSKKRTYRGVELDEE